MATGDDSVSVSFTADDSDIDAALDNISQKAEATAGNVEEAFDSAALALDTTTIDNQLDTLDTKLETLGQQTPTPTPDLDTATIDTQMDTLDGDLDKIGQKTPTPKPNLDDKEIDPKISGLDDKLDRLGEKKPSVEPQFDDKDADTKVDAFDAKLDKLGKKHPTVTPKVDDKDADTKVDDLDLKLDKLARKHPTVTPRVDDKDAVAKLTTLDALVDAISKKTAKINLKLSDKQLAELLSDDGGGGGTGGKGGKSGSDSGGAKKASKHLAKDVVDSVLGGMSKLTKLAVAGPIVDEAAGVLAGASAGLILTAFSGLNFGLALTGSKNPVTAKFKTQIETAMTKFDQNMAPYTAPALASTLAPITSYLTDVEPLVKGFGKGMSEMAGAMDVSLKSPQVKKLFSELGNDTSSNMKQLGPIFANTLQGMGQLIAAAEPVAQDVLDMFQSGSKAFASKGAGQSEGSFFKGLAKDMKQYGPEIGDIFTDFGTDVGLFLKDLKPLEGPALKEVDSGLKGLGNLLRYEHDLVHLAQEAGKAAGGVPVLGSIVKFIGDIDDALGRSQIGKGATEAGGIAALGLLFEKTRKIEGKAVTGVAGMLGKLAGHLPGVSQVEGLLGKLGGSSGKTSSTGTLGTAADNMLDASKTMMKAAEKMNTAGGEQETAGGEEEAAGDEELAAGGSGGTSVLKKLLAGGALGSAAGIGYVMAQDLIANFKTTGGAVTDSGILGKSNSKNTSSSQLAGLAQKDVEFLSGGDPQKMNAAGEKFAHWAKSAGFAQKQIVQALASAGLSKQAISVDTGASGKDLDKWVKEGLKQAAKTGGKGGSEVGTAILEALEQQLQSDKPKSAAAKQTRDLIAEVKKEYGIKSPSTVFTEIGQDLNLGLANGVADRTSVDSKVDSLTASILTKVKDLEPELTVLGKNLDLGLAQGITNNSTLATTAMTGVADAILTAAKVATGTNSPSTKYMEIGHDHMEGYALGLLDNMGLATSAARKASLAVLGAAGSTPGGGGRLAGAAVTQAPVINLYIQSPSGTLPPQTITQVKTVVTEALAEHDQALSDALGVL